MTLTTSYGKRQRKYTHTIYKKISHAVRLNCIFDHVIHAKPVHIIVKETGFSYNTVRNIIVSYLDHGRTNRKSFTRSSAHKSSKTAAFLCNAVPMGPSPALSREAPALLPCRSRLNLDSKSHDLVGSLCQSLKSRPSLILSIRLQPKPQTPLALLPTDWKANETFGGSFCGSSASGESGLKLVKLSPKEQMRDNTADSELVSSNILQFESENSTLQDIFTGPLEVWNVSLKIPPKNWHPKVQQEQKQALVP